MCSGRSARAGSRWIHGLSPSRSNVIMMAHRAPSGQATVSAIVSSGDAGKSERDRRRGSSIDHRSGRSQRRSARDQRDSSRQPRMLAGTIARARRLTLREGFLMVTLLRRFALRGSLVVGLLTLGLSGVAGAAGGGGGEGTSTPAKPEDPQYTAAVKAIK